MLLFEVLIGLTIAVIVSLLVVIARASAPNLSVLGRVPDTIEFGDIRRYPANRTLPGLLIVRPNEGLFFANAASLGEAIRENALTSEPKARMVIVDLELSFDLDVPSLDALAETKEALAAENIALVLVRVHEDVLEMLSQSGILDVIGAENIFPRILGGLVAYLESLSAGDTPELAILSERIHELVGWDRGVPYSLDGKRQGPHGGCPAEAGRDSPRNDAGG